MQVMAVNKKLAQSLLLLPKILFGTRGCTAGAPAGARKPSPPPATAVGAAVPPPSPASLAPPAAAGARRVPNSKVLLLLVLLVNILPLSSGYRGKNQWQNGTVVQSSPRINHPLPLSLPPVDEHRGCNCNCQSVPSPLWPVLYSFLNSCGLVVSSYFVYRLNLKVAEMNKKETQATLDAMNAKLDAIKKAHDETLDDMNAKLDAIKKALDETLDATNAKLDAIKKALRRKERHP